ncbi:hypothetical protein DERF_005058 [Dermatophagoides farinae]|uniref:Uncharacterized protein n=1 Tax=Dermatophagoides farinae TaxID=6954 RepID=A0A922L5U0_DERFA|nr:hypothetical protein DERF_005058 [Dermatophagoides farinae]
MIDSYNRLMIFDPKRIHSCKANLIAKTRSCRYVNGRYRNRSNFPRNWNHLLFFSDAKVNCSRAQLVAIVNNC